MKRLLATTLTAMLLGMGAAGADQLYAADAAWYHRDTARAVSLYRIAASQGNMIAQRRLGHMFAAGSAFAPPDPAEALRWYRLAAAQGDADAQDGLALLYRDGQGVPQDYAEALKWLRLAAAQQYYPGQYHLGQMYSAGLGVPRDEVRAYIWFSLGAAFDAGQIMAARDETARHLTQRQLADARKLAATCQLRNFTGCD